MRNKYSNLPPPFPFGRVPAGQPRPTVTNVTSTQRVCRVKELGDRTNVRTRRNYRRTSRLRLVAGGPTPLLSPSDCDPPPTTPPYLPLSRVVYQNRHGANNFFSARLLQILRLCLAFFVMDDGFLAQAPAVSTEASCLPRFGAQRRALFAASFCPRLSS